MNKLNFDRPEIIVEITNPKNITMFGQPITREQLQAIAINICEVIALAEK